MDELDEEDAFEDVPDELFVDAGELFEAFAACICAVIKVGEAAALAAGVSIVVGVATMAARVATSACVWVGLMQGVGVGVGDVHGEGVGEQLACADDVLCS